MRYIDSFKNKEANFHFYTRTNNMLGEGEGQVFYTNISMKKQSMKKKYIIERKESLRIAEPRVENDDDDDDVLNFFVEVFFLFLTN